MSLGSGTVAGRVIREGIVQTAGMSRDNRVGNVYPTSAMGAIAARAAANASGRSNRAPTACHAAATAVRSS